MSVILIATAGYSYDDWRGSYYPADLDKSEMLSYYAREFPFTEINSTYYRMPNKYMLSRMLEKVPETFQFVAKAHGSMTHEGDISDENVRSFTEALLPLMESDTLVGVLAQYPFRFKPGAASIKLLLTLKKKLEPIPLFVEFRNRNWISPKTHDLLRSEGICYVCVDEPGFKSLVPPVVWATGGIGYVRFHGRNSGKWWRHKQAYERYDYLYSSKELAEWVPRIRKLEQRTGKVYVAMNNHYRGQAVTNARMLSKLLAEPS